MPEEPFFREATAQRMLLDMLFIYCKMNQDTSYRQGMHELLAPILWVIEHDAIDPKELPSGPELVGIDPIMVGTLDSNFIEHDAFSLFTIVMRTAKSSYELGEPERKTSTTSSTSMPNGSSPIVERSKRIHEVLLARVDPELALHLTAVEVLPQIFLMYFHLIL
jgi:TBC1 domain family protein 5